METRWDSKRYVDPRTGGAREIPCIDDLQIGGLIGLVDDQADQPALVFARGSMGGCKNEFARIAVRSEVVHVPAASLQIVLQQAVGGDKSGFARFGQRHRIRVSVRPAAPALVDARKILLMIVDDGAADAALGWADCPALERAARSVRPE